MGRSGRTLLVATVAVGALAAASAVRAQSAAPPASSPSEASSSTAMSEVVVTANKREERLHDVALSVTALSGEDLQRRQELNLVDLSKQVPGFSIQQLGPSLNKLILRGENAGGTGATVAVVVDDVPFSFSSSTGNGAITTADIDTYDLQRVEVLRGPQGTLYGATAEGGLLKYVTKAADPRRFEAGGETGFNTIDGGGAGANVKGYVNLPLGDTFAIRVNGYYEDLPGYIDNPLTRKSDINDGYKYGGRVSLFWQPIPDLTVKAAAFLQKQKFNSTGQIDVVGAFTNPTAPPANQFDRASGDQHRALLPEFSNSQLNYYYLNLNYDLHWASLTSISSYGVLKFRSLGEIEGSPVAPGVTYASVLGPGVYGRSILATDGEYSDLKKYSQEVRLSSEPGLKVFSLPVEVQGGVFLTREISQIAQNFDALAATPPYATLAPDLGDDRAPSQYREVSVFGEADLHLLPQFDISAGLRRTNNTQRYNTQFFAGVLVGPDATAPISKSQESSTTFSVAPRWHVTPDTVLYARFASGFRPGGPIGAVPGAPADFPVSFRSDSTINYEGGLRTYLFDRKVSIDVAGFYIDWTDIQILSRFQSTITGVTTFVSGNAGAAETYGVEWSLGYTPFKGLNITAVGSWTEAHLTTDAPGLGAFSGDRLAFVPDVSSTLNVDYQWPLYREWRGFVGGSWTYTGSQFTNFGISPVAVNHARLPSYNTETLRGGVENDRYTAELFVRNLSDERAIVGYSSAGALGGFGTANFIQPRTFGARLTFKY